MKVFRAAAMIALLSWPVLAVAQEAPLPQAGAEQKAKSPHQIEEEQATDRAYKRSLNNIPDAPPVDPWGNARAAETPAKQNVKTAVKTAPSKLKPKPAGTPAN